MGKLLSEREEEFYSYQNSATADDGMRHAAAAASPPPACSTLQCQMAGPTRDLTGVFASRAQTMTTRMRTTSRASLPRSRRWTRSTMRMTRTMTTWRLRTRCEGRGRAVAQRPDERGGSPVSRETLPR